MFNCKKLFKLQIRRPSLILLITTSQDKWIFPSQRWEVRNSIIKLINTTARLGEFLKKIWDRRALYIQYIRSTDRQPIVAEGVLLWLSKGDLKGETEGKTIAAQDRELKPKSNKKTKYWKQKQTTIVNYVNNMITTLYELLRIGKRTTY